MKSTRKMLAIKKVPLVSTTIDIITLDVNLFAAQLTNISESCRPSLNHESLVLLKMF